MPITKLANLLSAPRKTFNDWNNGQDYKKLIIEILQHLGEEKIKELLDEIEETDSFRIYSKEDIRKRFLSMFPSLAKYSHEYKLFKLPFSDINDFIKLQHKRHDNEFIIFLDLLRLSRLSLLEKTVKEYHSNAAIDGINLKIVILTDNSDEQIQEKCNAINPETNEPYIPDYVNLENIRTLLNIDDSVILR